ncbi:hypothetical protein M0R45_006405 [Rubus argutus]|uniref:Ribosomal protein L36 n=1 Tax=Rubus argutus TaxID=59490 RepID=A0AAW1YQH9_RUBAR
MAPSQPKSRLFVGLNRGHVTTKCELTSSREKGRMSFRLNKAARLIPVAATLLRVLLRQRLFSLPSSSFIRVRSALLSS